MIGETTVNVEGQKKEALIIISTMALPHTGDLSLLASHKIAGSLGQKADSSSVHLLPHIWIFTLSHTYLEEKTALIVKGFMEMGKETFPVNKIIKFLKIVMVNLHC